MKGDSRWTSSVDAMIEDLGWDSLADRRREIRLALFYKSVHGLIAIPTENILIPADTRTRHGIDRPYMFSHIFAQRDEYKNSFFPRTIRQWNSLPLSAVLPPAPGSPASGQSHCPDYLPTD